MAPELLRLSAHLRGGVCEDRSGEAGDASAKATLDTCSHLWPEEEDAPGARRLIPRSWSWFTVLYVVPSFVLGVVGMGRYATDTFPPVVSAGVLLANRSRRTIVATLAVFAVAQLVCIYFYIARRSLI